MQIIWKTIATLKRCSFFVKTSWLWTFGVPFNKIDKFFIVTWVVWCKYWWWCKTAWFICSRMVRLRCGQLGIMRIPSCHMCVNFFFAASTATLSSQSNVSIFGAFANQIKPWMWVDSLCFHSYLDGRKKHILEINCIKIKIDREK